MTIKIQGNRIDNRCLHVWILVSDLVKGWTDVPFTIDTPKFDTLQELVNYLEEKEEKMVALIQGKLNRGVELKHYNVVGDRPELITDDTVLKEIEMEKKIKEKLREMAIKELEKEEEL